MHEFGTPEELAESFLAEISSADLMTDLNRRKRKIACTGCVLMSVAILFAVYALYVEHTTAVGIIESITIYQDPSKFEPPSEFEVQTPVNIEN